jgi:hypothetical protein
MITPIAGIYRDFMPRLPIIRAPGSPQIAMMGRPTLEQLLAPSPREQKIAMETQRLPSPSALSMLI